MEASVKVIPDCGFDKIDRCNSNVIKAGPLSVLPYLSADLLILEVLKLILNLAEGLAGRLSPFDGGETTLTKLPSRRDCRVCSDSKSS
jgi:hypothetical protein